MPTKASLDLYEHEAPWASTSIRPLVQCDNFPSLTLSEYMLTLLECPQSLDLAAKTKLQLFQYQQLLARWKEAGLPDLGEWPKEGVEWQEWENSLSF